MPIPMAVINEKFVLLKKLLVVVMFLIRLKTEYNMHMV